MSSINRSGPIAAAAAGIVLLLSPAGPAFAVPPAEVGNVLFPDAATLSWDAVAGADDYDVYRGLASEFSRGVPVRCHGTAIATTSFQTPAAPPAGEAYAYLVTGHSAIDGDGTPGQESGGAERALLGHCRTVMKAQILDRLGYGWSDWSSQRIDALGWQGYVDEQLAPETIDESTNTDLNSRIPLLSPPQDLNDLVYLRNDKQLYARRQLERYLTEFWSNHFTTFYFKTFEYLLGFFPGANQFEKTARNTADVHLREEESFEALALNGTFRDIIEASTLSAAMMIYLDNVVNVVGRPNENYARELMELHSMGVDCGYNETDVRQLARVFTGWEVCKKAIPDKDNPLAPCIDPIFGGEGRWTSNFNPANHDHGQKTIFAGTPYETIIPDTSANPDQGINDVQIALDVIADHPCTLDFISMKLLRRFITDTPSQAMIDAVVAQWQASFGDLREVTRAVLAPENLFDPDYATAKVKTPQEQILSAYRGMRGRTTLAFPNLGLSYANLFSWELRMNHLPYNRVEPDGYPDKAPPWIGTNQLLDRQDYGMAAAVDTLGYQTNVTEMVTDFGLDTADKIIDFFAEILLGGQITPAERQIALDYLNTDEFGNPSPYDDARVREAVGLLLGFAQFMER